MHGAASDSSEIFNKEVIARANRVLNIPYRIQAILARRDDWVSTEPRQYVF